MADLWRNEKGEVLTEALIGVFIITLAALISFSVMRTKVKVQETIERVIVEMHDNNDVMIREWVDICYYE